MVAVEVDGDVLEGFEGADDAFDADPGGLLEVAGYGQGGHDHGQVGLDGVSGVVEDRPTWLDATSRPSPLGGLWVADIPPQAGGAPSYVRTFLGESTSSSPADVFSRQIVETSTSLYSDLAPVALEMAVWQRKRQGG